MSTGAIDLSGGLDEAFEYFRAEAPSDPGFRDSATLWVIDQGGKIALPRVTIDAVGDDWENPRIQLNFARDDGAILRVWNDGVGGVRLDEDGKAASRSAGSLRFTCIEPFRRWRLEFDGLAERTTTSAEMAGIRQPTTARLAFNLEAVMAAPPWLMGGMTTEAAQAMLNGEASALMGGVRYEQLCRIEGRLTYEGAAHKVDATGMRVRRQGVRNMGAALGHCQHSALFPSGRAFGAIFMAPGPDGPEAFNEAYVILPSGRKLGARIVRAPWMTRFLRSGDDASLVLATEEGEISIEGSTLLTMYDHYNFEMADTSVLHQGTARYVWDGEETIGLIERCTRRERLEGLPESAGA